MRRGAIVAAIVTAAIALGGCSAPPDSAPLPEGVSVELRQQRDDVAARNAQLMVRNDSSQAITIDAVRVSDPRLDGDALRAVPRSTRLPAGSSVNIRIALPPVDCGADEGVPRAQLEITTDAGEMLADVALVEPTAVIAPIHDRECLAEKVAESLELEWSSFVEAPPGEPGTLVLSAASVGDGAGVRIMGVQETPLLAAASDGPGWAIDVAGTQQVTLHVVPNRCDPHVVQEDKRGTIFTLDVVVGDSPGTIELPVSPEMKGQILAWVALWCGFGG